ncbi:MAG TPA: pyridoxal 5'-phosphate synthase glutaminase subunit PdxT [Methanoculleus sp.]|nr:pyridoxal 5'-phosphate synthase glutaminase subunit PdxT [Methanoculleus sp.]
MGIRIGVLALQGNVSEHIRAFERALDALSLKGEVIPLRNAEDIPRCDAIAIPGGESTTISRLISKNRMREPLKSFHGGIFATCAGMVLVASEVDDSRVEPLGLMDITVARNAFGRQRDSCEMPIVLEGDREPFPGYFIRAPVVESVGPAATVICRADHVVGAVQGKHMALSFHPELGGDLRLHIRFLRNLIEA